MLEPQPWNWATTQTSAITLSGLRPASQSSYSITFKCILSILGVALRLIASGRNNERSISLGRRGEGTANVNFACTALSPIGPPATPVARLARAILLLIGMRRWHPSSNIRANPAMRIWPHPALALVRFIKVSMSVHQRVTVAGAREPLLKPRHSCSARVRRYDSFGV